MNVQTPVKPSLTLKRRIKAPPAKVFAAWTDPALMARWLGPVGTVELIAKTDPRVGGRYEMKMRMPDDEHNVSGVYLRVRAEPEARLHVGLAHHAGAGVAGDGGAEAGRRRHASHAHPLAVLRRSRHATATTKAGAARSESSSSFSPERETMLPGGRR